MKGNIDKALAEHRANWTMPDEPVARFIVGMRKLGVIQAQWEEHSLAPHGITLHEADILFTLRRNPPPHALTPSRLRSHVLVTPGALAKQLAQLEAKGLVERSLSEGDQRVKPVWLTPRGKKVAERAFDDLLKSIGGWLRSHLSREVLDIVNQAFEPLLADAAPKPPKQTAPRRRTAPTRL